MQSQCAPPEEWALPPSSNDSEVGAQPGPEPGKDAPTRRRRWPLVLAGIISFVLVAFVVALLLLVSPQDSAPYPEGFTWEKYSTDGLVPRQWSVGVPDNAGDEPLPAIVTLHPLGGNRSGWVGETDLDALARQQGFVLVVPQGLWGMWNTGECCGPAAALGVDDVGFLDEVMADTAARPDVDPDRIYMAGLSNGGLMTTRYLCEGEHMPAAAASVAVIPWSLEGCDGSVPLLMSVGTEDELFPMAGGRTLLGTLASGRTSRSWSEATDELVEIWQCTGDPEVVSFELWSRPREPTTGWERSDHEDCTSPLRLTVVDAVPHTWLWGGDWSHTREVLDFFEHSKVEPQA